LERQLVRDRDREYTLRGVRVPHTGDRRSLPSGLQS
jgi:hypothetical protein